MEYAEFENFEYIVLCDGMFDSGYETKVDALDYINRMKRRFPNRIYTLFDMDTGDERELEKIWVSYQQMQEELDWDWER